MHLLYALIVTIFLTTITSTAPTPTPTPAPATNVAVFTSPDVFTAEALQAVADVVEARLVALDVDYVAVEIENIGDLWMLVRVEIAPEALTPRVVELLTQPGYLEFVDVDALDPLEQTDALIWTTGQAQRADDPAAPPEDALLDPETERPFKTILDGTEITRAEALVDPNYDAWIVEITLSAAASARLGEYSAEHVGEALGIVIDGKIITAPTINGVISSPIWISGNFTETEARELAAQLDSGPLSVTLEYAGLQSALE